MGSPLVYIVILNWNQYDDTKECLDSLPKINYPNYRVVLVDNGSHDKSGERLKSEFPQHVFIFSEKNLGFAEGNNVGIQKALEDKNCDYIFCLNNDTIVEPNFLDELIKIARDKKFKEFGSFQPCMVWYYHPNLLDSAGLEYGKNGLGFNRGGFSPRAQYMENGQILGPCGGAALYRASAIRHLIKRDGFFFDPDFFIYYEDMDVALRLQMSGWKSFYIASAIVLHKRGGVTKISKNVSRHNIFLSHRNNIFVIAKNWPTRAILKNLVALLAAQCFAVGFNFIKRRGAGFVVAEGKAVGIMRWRCMRKRGTVARRETKNWESIERFFVKKWRANRPLVE